MIRKLALEELGRISIEAFKHATKMPVTVVLDNIRSAHNVGAAFRTADCFLVEQVVLCGITAQPPHREILKTALGATESVDWYYASDTLEAVEHLRSKGWKIWAVEQASGSVPLQNFSFGDSDEKIALVFGNEVGGVDDAVVNMADGVVEVPQFGTKHSLNISVCLGVVLWEVFRNWKFNIAK